MIFVTSLVIWLTETVKYWFVMHAFPGHGFSRVVLCADADNGVVNLATTIPSAPVTWARLIRPASRSQGVWRGGGDGGRYTVVLHVALWLPITLLGFWYWRARVKVE